MSQDINQKIEPQKVYEYGGSKFTNCYYKEKLGQFKLFLLCLRRAMFYTGEILKCCATDIFYIWKPSHPSEPLVKKIILSVTFLISLVGVLSVPGLIVGLCLELTLLTGCTFGILVTIAALALVVFTCKFVKSCIKYMRKNSKDVKQIVLEPCGRNGEIHFHEKDDSLISTHKIEYPSKNINIDLNYIPRSLVTAAWSCYDR